LINPALINKSCVYNKEDVLIRYKDPLYIKMSRGSLTPQLFGVLKTIFTIMTVHIGWQDFISEEE